METNPFKLSYIPRDVDDSDRDAMPELFAGRPVYPHGSYDQAEEEEERWYGPFPLPAFASGWRKFAARVLIGFVIVFLLLALLGWIDGAK